jgi:hypothetical protein
MEAIDLIAEALPYAEDADFNPILDAKSGASLARKMIKFVREGIGDERALLLEVLPYVAANKYDESFKASGKERAEKLKLEIMEWLRNE